MGVTSCSSQAFPVGEHSVLEKQFSVSIFLLGHSTSAMWLICVSLFVLWPSTPRKKCRPPPQVLESSHSILGFLCCSPSIRCWPFHHSSFECCWFQGQWVPLLFWELLLFSELYPPVRSFWKDLFIVLRVSSICFHATFLRGLSVSFLLLSQTSHHKLSGSYNTHALVLEARSLTYLFLG